MKEKLEKVINVLILVKDFLAFKNLKESTTEKVDSLKNSTTVSKIKNLFKK